MHASSLILWACVWSSWVCGVRDSFMWWLVYTIISVTSITAYACWLASPVCYRVEFVTHSCVERVVDIKKLCYLLHCECMLTELPLCGSHKVVNESRRWMSHEGEWVTKMNGSRRWMSHELSHLKEFELNTLPNLPCSRIWNAHQLLTEPGLCGTDQKLVGQGMEISHLKRHELFFWRISRPILEG